jgi:hypothetical protein
MLSPHPFFFDGIATFRAHKSIINGAIKNTGNKQK